MMLDRLDRRLKDLEWQQARPAEVKLVWYDEEPDPGAEIIKLRWLDEVEKKY
jgi:hypothetical protein